MHDLDADGFADMYAQTIAYGLLSARIADPHKKTVDDFASHMRTNPLLRDLMETFLKAWRGATPSLALRGSTSTSSALLRSSNYSTTPRWTLWSATSETETHEKTR